MSKPISHSYTREPECPYCGGIEKDAWEINFGPGMEGETEITCGHCEREYKCSRQVEITYSTHPLTHPTP